jgi:hypothetical protein
LLQECQKQICQELGTQLLTLGTPLPVQQHTQALLASLAPSKAAYHNHKVSSEYAMA